MFTSLGSLLNSFRIPFRRRSVQSVFSRRGRRRGFVPSLGSHSALGVSLHDTLSHEPLEQRRLLAVDVSLTGQVLTVSFDDASADSVNLSITPTGYESTGSNVSSGTGTISQLVVQDAGTAEYSGFFLMEANQVLSGGLSIGPNINNAAFVNDSVDTNGGNISIEAGELFLALEYINSGGGSQNYTSAIVLASDVRLETATGVGATEIYFGGTIDSSYPDLIPSALELYSESINATADIGGTYPLASLSAVTEQDSIPAPNQRGQFYRSVHTTGDQTYQAGLSSGDIEFNGTYTSDAGDLSVLGAGTDGVVLSLTGDTQIDVGTGEFSVQKGSSVSYPGGNIISQGGSQNLTNSGRQHNSTCRYWC